MSFEKIRLSCINIIISTPGRLLHHMDENEHFSYSQLQMLCIDEADRILDLGFRQEVIGAKLNPNMIDLAFGSRN